MVQQHMKNNPNAVFASTKQTVDALNSRDSLDNFHERRIGFNPSKEKSDQKDIKGITVEAFYLPHGPDSRIINNGFLVTVNGVSFFHTGDVDFDQFTFEEFRSYQLPEKKIDLSFIQHFYLTNDSTSKLFVTKGIGGNYILPIHYHFTTPSFDAANVKENYPDAILFDKELETWEMPENKEELNQTIAWKKLTSFPNTTSGAKPIVLNNEIYYIPSSYAPRSITSDFYKYDIPSDTWIKLANMPEAKGNLAVGEASGNIYAIGGGFTKTNFKYTLETDTWRTLDSMPTARQHIDCGVVDNKIYVIGGITSFTNITKKNEMYDPETNSWSTMAPIPTLRNNPAIVTKDSLIYVIGGAGSEKSIWTTIATVECYNPKTDEWTTKADLPFALFKPGAVVVNNKIIVLGGQDPSGKSVSSVLIYDIESDSWEKTTPLPQINCFAGYATVGNKIYMIGGTTSAPDWTYYSDVYEGTIIDSSKKK
jgi:N-acetylneuraminic acid mutarotase